MEILPDEVYEHRMRKTLKCHKRRGRGTSKKLKFGSRFNLIITNVPEHVLPNEVVPAFYKIRWQVELIPKIWKSIIGMHHNRVMKYTRWLCLLHFKIHMCIFSKENGMLREENTPFKNPIKLLYMSKNTRINPVLQRNGVKIITCLLSKTYKIWLTAMTCMLPLHWTSRFAIRRSCQDNPDPAFRSHHILCIYWQKPGSFICPFGSEIVLHQIKSTGKEIMALSIEPDSTRGRMIIKDWFKLPSYFGCCHMDKNRFIAVTDDLAIDIFEFGNLD